MVGAREAVVGGCGSVGRRVGAVGGWLVGWGDGSGGETLHVPATTSFWRKTHTGRRFKNPTAEERSRYADRKLKQ